MHLFVMKMMVERRIFQHAYLSVYSYHLGMKEVKEILKSVTSDVVT